MFDPLLALARLLEIALQAYFWIIVARVVLSWVNADRFNPIVRFIYRVTEPVLRPIRERLPTYQMGLDLSPLVVVVGLQILDWLVVGYVRQMASGLR